jgi:predicted HicB family RNase H-like nuclease
MKYNGYIGQFTFDEKLELFQGKVSNIKDLITFQGKSMETLRDDFKDAINEYVAWCKKAGKDPEKPSQKDNPFSYSP